MSNNWHSPTPDLISGDVARAEDINDKISAIDVAFDMLPEPHPTEKGFDEPIHVGTATEPGHATTKLFVETGMTSQVVAAAASAAAALSSQTSASLAAASAGAAEGAAQASQSAAAASQSAAATSATTASTGATTATTQAAAAVVSAAAALASQTAAASSASAASGSATTASTQATNAAASAVAAAASASAASGSASSASTSASTASTAASTATTQASNASTSAANALTAENNAETAETNAEAAEALAEMWAENPEDDEVTTGKFSALHWAAKAQLAASAFAIVAGNTGTATADTNGDTLTISGSNGITTTAASTPDSLTITPTYGTTPSAITAGTAASAGVANTIARTDHVHSITTAAAATLTASTTNAEGSSGSLARADHLHTITTGAPSTNLTASTTNSIGVAASIARSDHSHAITTAAASGLTADTANGAGSSASLARADHSHAISTAVAVALGAAASAGVSAALSRADHVHPYPTAANVDAMTDPGSNGIVVRTADNVTVARTLTAPAAGITITNGSGVSGNPTLVLANDLAALEGLSGTGLIARTGTSTFEERTLTAPAAGITVTNGGGVAGNPTLVLANDLAALEGLASTGIAVRTASDTWAQRTIAVPATGLTITNGSGVAGNPTLALANDLAALEGLASTGIAVRTGSDAWAQRTITGTTGEIDVTNGSGASGNPTLALGAKVGRTVLAGDISAGSTTITLPAGTFKKVTITLLAIKAASNFSIGMRYNSDATASYDNEGIALKNDGAWTDPGDDNTWMNLSRNEDELVETSSVTRNPYNCTIVIWSPNAAEYTDMHYQASYRDSEQRYVNVSGSGRWESTAAATTIQILLFASLSGGNPSGAAITPTSGTYYVEAEEGALS